MLGLCRSELLSNAAVHIVQLACLPSDVFLSGSFDVISIYVAKFHSSLTLPYVKRREKIRDVSKKLWKCRGASAPLLNITICERKRPAECVGKHLYKAAEDLKSGSQLSAGPLIVLELAPILLFDIQYCAHKTLESSIHSGRVNFWGEF
jgi:hypothetical protein